MEKNELNKLIEEAECKLNTELYIRNITLRSAEHMMFLILTLGPTPKPFIDSPDENEFDLTLNIRPGSKFRKVAESIVNATNSLKVAYTNRSMVTH